MSLKHVFRQIYFFGQNMTEVALAPSCTRGGAYAPGYDRKVGLHVHVQGGA